MSRSNETAPVVVIGNYKGGVGKTFLTKHLGEYAAIRKGMKTLLIDLDPQTNLSRRYLDMQSSKTDEGNYQFSPPAHPDFLQDPVAWDGVPDWGGVSDSAEIWIHGQCTPYPTEYPGLEIVPAHSTRLQLIEYVRQRDVFEQVVVQLRAFLVETGTLEDYDLVVIDTRPSTGPLLQSAMYAATDLLIPTEMEAPSVEGLPSMLSVRSQVNLMRSEDDDPLRLIGILANKVDKRTAIHREYMSMVREDPDTAPLMMENILSYWSGYKETMIYDQPSPFVHGSGIRKREREQLSAVCEEILGNLERT